MNFSDNANFNYWYEKYNFNDDIEEKLYRYYELIHEHNQYMNLTGIDDLEGVYLKHFYDSLTVTDLVDLNQKLDIADVGTGAGFPGLVLAICYPEITMHLIEPLTKRCKFLSIVVENLNLNNVVIINERSEDVDQKYDVIFSRAVARLNILTELCSQLVKNGGYFISLKGKQGIEEIKEAEFAIKELGFKVDEVDEVVLPIENSSRVNIKMKKIKNTKFRYPRNYGQIKKKPL